MPSTATATASKARKRDRRAVMSPRRAAAPPRPDMFYSLISVFVTVRAWEHAFNRPNRFAHGDSGERVQRANAVAQKSLKSDHLARARRRRGDERRCDCVDSPGISIIILGPRRGDIPP